MICFANNQTAPFVRRMWKTCFNDSEEYMDLYFGRKYRNENTLLWLEDDTPIASLQILPYTMRFYGSIVPVGYIAGVCTLPEYRGKGYAKQLLKVAHEILRERKIPLGMLVPASNGLFNYYARCGYEKVFDKGDIPIDLSAFLPYYPDDMGTAYGLFDETYQQCDFCVLKTTEDFSVIMDEAKLFDFPPKSNLAGMAHIIDVETLLQCYAAKNQDKSFRINVSDMDNYAIRGGKATQTTDITTDLNVDEQLLARLLFGYHLEELPPVYRRYFEEQHPVLNLMLE
jgi:predicted acetyltransferase